MNADDINQNTTKSRSNKKRWLIFALVIILSSTTSLYVYNVVQIESIMKENRNLERKKAEIEVELEMIRSRIIQMESPDRIIPIAKQRLGMIESDTTPERINLKEK